MRRSCTASSGPQLHGSLGSTGQRPTLPHYSLDPVHGPGVGLRLRPQLLPPACPRRACSVGLGFFRSVAFLPRSPGPCWSPVFRSAIFDCSSLNVSFLSFGTSLSLNYTDVSARVARVVSAWDFFVPWRTCRVLPAPVAPQFFALQFVTICH